MRFLMTCVFLLLMLFAMAAGEGRKPAQATSNSDVLSAESKEFVDYARDFLDMQTSYVDERLDSDIAGSLYEVANHNMERSGLLGSLVSVYEGTDCSKHHDEYRALVNTEILTASKQIDLDIKAVQVGIADTAKPGLAAEARRMKNDLQASKRNWNKSESRLIKNRLQHINPVVHPGTLRRFGDHRVRTRHAQMRRRSSPAVPHESMA